jgi:hypothetical protein
VTSPGSSRQQTRAATQWTYWFLTQVAMLIGFATTFPVNWWPINNGTKEKM